MRWRTYSIYERTSKRIVINTSLTSFLSSIIRMNINRLKTTATVSAIELHAHAPLTCVIDPAARWVELIRPIEHQRHDRNVKPHRGAFVYEVKIAIGVASLTFFSLLNPLAVAQPSERKSYTQRGTVEQVNIGANRLSVANEPIPGGMGAMTMNYAVDKK